MCAWVHARLLQSCPTLCDSMDRSPPGSSVHRDPPGIYICVCVCVCMYKYICICIYRASQVVLLVKNPPANAGDIRDMGSIPGLGRSPGGGHGNPFQ